MTPLRNDSAVSMIPRSHDLAVYISISGLRYTYPYLIFPYAPFPFLSRDDDKPHLGNYEKKFAAARTTVLTVRALTNLVARGAERLARRYWVLVLRKRGG
jgi:hypothetical protein